MEKSPAFLKLATNDPGLYESIVRFLKEAGLDEAKVRTFLETAAQRHVNAITNIYWEGSKDGIDKVLSKLRIII